MASGAWNDAPVKPDSSKKGSVRTGLLAVASMIVLIGGCSWPDYGYVDSRQGCKSSMLVCSDFETDPFDVGWTTMENGGATFAPYVAPFGTNRSLRFQTMGSEVMPEPEAQLFRSLPGSATKGRLMFHLRIQDLGVYTQLTVVELAYGTKSIRFALARLNDNGDEGLVLRYVGPDPTNSDTTQVIWEHLIPDAEQFRQQRWLELLYDFAGSTPSVSLDVEGTKVLEMLALDVETAAAVPTLRVGILEMIVPCSRADFALDDVGVDVATSAP
jgi:hypothetical protein